MKVYDELVIYYDDEKAKLDRKEKVDTLKLANVGYALDTVDFFKRQDLDFTFDSLEIIQKLIAAMNDTLTEDVPKEKIMAFAKMFCGYISVVLLRELKGEYVSEDAEKIKDFKNGPAIEIKGTYYFILSKVYRRLTADAGDDGDNLWWYVKTIRQDVNNK